MWSFNALKQKGLKIMKKLIAISLIYLSSFALLTFSCSKSNFSQFSTVSKKKIDLENITTRQCTNNLVKALGYSHEEFTERVMECNILKIQSLDAKIRKIKGQRRIEIVYLNVVCDEIAKNLIKYEKDCKNGLTVTKF